MRKIMFRGQRIDNGEWVHCGNLIHFNEGDEYYIPVFNSKCICTHDENDNILSFDEVMFCKVRTNTIGQYIGLTDKNGKMIFEGDVIKCCDFIGIINYNMGCYCVRTNKPDWKSRNNPAIDIVMNEYPNEIEIIGNIHDSPNFWGGGDNESVIQP